MRLGGDHEGRGFPESCEGSVSLVPASDRPFIRRTAVPRVEDPGPRTLEEMHAAHKERRRKEVVAESLHLRRIISVLQDSHAIERRKWEADRTAWEQEEARLQNQIEVLKGQAKENIRFKIGFISEVVAKNFNITVADINSHCQSGGLSRPRQIVMYLARKELKESFPRIARCMGGRDHTTIFNGVRKIEAMMVADPSFRAEVEALREAVTRDE